MNIGPRRQHLSKNYTFDTFLINHYCNLGNAGVRWLQISLPREYASLKSLGVLSYSQSQEVKELILFRNVYEKKRG
jgi:hypothetical protein